MPRPRPHRLLLALCAGLLAACTHQPASDPGSEGSPSPRIQAPPITADRALTPTLAGRCAHAIEFLSEGVRTARITEDLKTLASLPRPAGSAANARIARDLHARFRLAGLSSELVVFHGLLPEVEGASAELILPTAYRAPFEEPSLDRDFDTHRAPLGPGAVSFSPGGQVSGPLVYAHLGRAEDWSRLRQSGISGEGSIALVRAGPQHAAGASMRAAAEAGAAGIVFWADPLEQGSRNGPAWPTGSWRPDFAIPRLCGLDPDQRPGDPLTPGVPASEGVERISFDAATSLPSIPAVTLSTQEALPFLEQLPGAPVPADWQAGVGIPLRMGGLPAAVASIEVQANWVARPLTNVVGRLEGTLLPDEWIVVAARLDAPGYGAATSASGMAILLEAARVLGTLAGDGYRPVRTVLFLALDGETSGHQGATEWLESLTEAERDRIAVWIDLSRGAAGHQSVVHCDPLWSTQARIALGTTPVQRVEAELTPLERARALIEQRNLDTGAESLLDLCRLSVAPRTGAGSTGWLASQAYGIPLIEVGAEGPVPVANTRYDTVAWLKQHGDPGLKRHADLARISAALIYRLASDAHLAIDPFALSDWLHARMQNLPLETAQRQRFLEGDEALRRAAQSLAKSQARLLASDPPVRHLGGTNAAISRWIRARAPRPPEDGVPWAHHLLVGPTPGAPRTPRELPVLGARATEQELANGFEDLMAWLRVFEERLGNLEREADRVLSETL